MAYWGNLSCLHSTISADQVLVLEEAISAHRRGYFQNAANLILTEFPDYRKVPVAAIALADVFESQGLEGRRADVLRETIDSSRSWLHAAVGNEKLLLQILWADANLRFTSRFRNWLSYTLNAKQSFRSFDISAVTEVEVRFLLEFRQIIALCEQESNWVSSDDANFQFLGDIAPTNPLQRLKTIMLEKSDIRSALRLLTLDLKQNIEKLGWRAGIETIESTCAMIENSSNPAKPSDLHRILTAQLTVTDVAVSHGFRSELLDQIKKCQTLQDRLDAMGFRSPWTNMGLKILRYRTNLPENNEERVRGYLDLCKEAHDSKDFIRCRQCLIFAGRIIDAALSKNSADEGIVQLARQVRMRRLRLETDDTESKYFYAHAVRDYAYTLMVIEEHTAERFHLVQNFFNQNVGIDPPQVLSILAKHGEVAASKSADEAAQERFAVEFARYQAQGPDAEVSSESKFVLKASARDKSGSYYREIYSRDQYQMLLNVIRVLVRLAHFEVSSGRLSSSDQITMLGPRSFIRNEEADASAGWPVSVCDWLLGPRADPVSERVWKPRLGLLEAWLRRPHTSTTEEVRHYYLKMLQQSRVQMLVRKIGNLGSIKTVAANVASDKLFLDLFESTKDYARILTSIDEEARGPEALMEAKRQEIGAIAALAGSFTAIVRGHLTDEMLRYHAEELGKEVCDHWRSAGRLELLYSLLMERARMTNQRNVMFHTVMTDAQAPLLEEAERLSCRMRQASAISQFRKFDAQDYKAKTAVVRKLNITNLYHNALTSSLSAYFWTLQNPAISSSLVDAKLEAFILWAEKSKARTLLDQLGVGGRVPERLLKTVESRQDYQEMLREEDILLAEISRAEKERDLPRQIQQRDELTGHRTRMKEVSSLKEVISFRDGNPLNYQDIQSMLERMESGTTLVSYVLVRDYYPSGLWLLIFRKSYRPRLIHTMTMAGVNGWLNINMVGDEPLCSEEAWETIEDISCLIAPLESLTSPGSDIVFCPVQSLHRIPLHALRIGGQTLIERNPVVYCHSFSLLHYCQMHAEEQIRKANVRVKAALFCPLLPSWQDLQLKESMRSVTGFESLYKNYIPQKTVLRRLHEASLVVFHGHVEFVEGQGMQQYLNFYHEEAEAKPVDGTLPIIDQSPLKDSDSGDTSILPATESSLSGSSPLSHSFQSSRTTAEEIFSLSLHPAALVFLIGCQSGKSEITSTDDLLGLTAAFLSAGAACVISTLWKIRNDDATEFLREFFTLLDADRRENVEAGVVDVVDLTRRVILKLQTTERGRRQGETENQDGMRLPYYWAGFVVNGSGKLPAGLIYKNG